MVLGPHIGVRLQPASSPARTVSWVTEPSVFSYNDLDRFYRKAFS